MRKYRTNDNEIFGDSGKISQKFGKTEKLSVNLGDTLKKCKRKKNLGNIKKIGYVFGNF